MRDNIRNQKLLTSGYKVLRFWEHDIKAMTILRL